MLKTERRIFAGEMLSKLAVSTARICAKEEAPDDPGLDKADNPAIMETEKGRCDKRLAR